MFNKTNIFPYVCTMNTELNKFRVALGKAHTEEDVKAAYAKTFDIGYDTSDYIDLYTPQVLFEFKYDKNLKQTKERSRVLAQSLYYIRRLKFGDVEVNSSQLTLFDMDKLICYIKPVPPVICLGDVNEAIISDTETWKKFYTSDAYDWDLLPSNPDEQLVNDIASTNEMRSLHVFNLNDNNELQLFYEKMKQKLNPQLTFEGFVEKKQITERNFEQVFSYWNLIFGDAVRNGYKTSRYFVSDIQQDNTIFLPSEGKALFRIENSFIDKKILARDYNWFWSLFDKVTDLNTMRAIIAKTDRLTDPTMRRFYGEFFTPIPFARKALDYIERTIGKNWWESGEYRLWDMAAGTGNLEYDLPQAALQYCYLSTLYVEDIEHLEKLFPDASTFQYDYLNDDIEMIASKTSQRKDEFAFGQDTIKLPKRLRDDLNNPKLKWIILINPPFATAQNASTAGPSKDGVADTKIRKLMHADNLGEVSRELFSQFIYRIKHEFTGKQSYLALFSKIKYINATNDQKLRDGIFRFGFERGFVFSSANFAGTSRASQFPVGMLIWNLAKSQKIEEQTVTLDVFNEKVEKIGQKTLISENKEHFLSKWIERPAATEKFPPFSSAIAVNTTNKDRRDRIAKDFLASLMCNGNDFQHQNYVSLLSGPYVSAGALSVTPTNFGQAMVVHAARLIPKANWLNDRDQFMSPNCGLPSEFITDCTVWNLFCDHNQTAALSNVEYEGKIYQIHNQLFPFSIARIKAWRFSDTAIRNTLLKAEDSFAAQWLQNHTLSSEAQAVLTKGEEIYKFYCSHLNELRTPKFKISTWDAGWWQIRMALKDVELCQTEIAELKRLHNVLRNKLLPQLVSFGIIG